MSPDLIRIIARAIFVRRHFTDLSLSNLVWTYEQHDMVVAECEAWRQMSEQEKLVWFEKAEQWLLDLKINRPNVFQIVADGVVLVE